MKERMQWNEMERGHTGVAGPNSCGKGKKNLKRSFYFSFQQLLGHAASAYSPFPLAGLCCRIWRFGKNHLFIGQNIWSWESLKATRSLLQVLPCPFSDVDLMLGYVLNTNVSEWMGEEGPCGNNAAASSKENR
ncbi:uncharacterized protein [Elaeis guineensis]|uniref:uncharacterized protein isoform X2 n=1 Tax=Elaeis guineensis var. tenera TaxID=51953 RepID=UPI003C6D0889